MHEGLSPLVFDRIMLFLSGRYHLGSFAPGWIADGVSSGFFFLKYIDDSLDWLDKNNKQTQTVPGPTASSYATVGRPLCCAVVTCIRLCS